ncbi:hypothetical protein [Nonomuraea sp. NPDC049709]|uniref:alpha/beta fold hydrolase n=1 Tax=Nonomuraea sp. NPDC049709 TaxID=3154736 RepID=UPI00341B923E
MSELAAEGDTMPFYRTGARHAADHVPDGQVREIPGAGHAAPLTHPVTLAKALTESLAVTRPPGPVS